MIHSKDAVFSKNCMYKDKIEKTNEKIVGKEYVNPNEPKDAQSPMFEKDEEKCTFEGGEEIAILKKEQALDEIDRRKSH